MRYLLPDQLPDLLPPQERPENIVPHGEVPQVESVVTPHLDVEKSQHCHRGWGTLRHLPSQPPMPGPAGYHPLCWGRLLLHRPCRWLSRRSPPPGWRGRSRTTWLGSEALQYRICSLLVCSNSVEQVPCRAHIRGMQECALQLQQYSHRQINIQWYFANDYLRRNFSISTMIILNFHFSSKLQSLFSTFFLLIWLLLTCHNLKTWQMLPIICITLLSPSA